MQIAIIGSGIAGLGAAHILDHHSDHQVTVYEADDRLGGHSNTVTVDDPSAGRLNIDTGFIVHNRRNYPQLLKLFAELGIETQPSEMTFGVVDEQSGLTYSATSISSLFAQRKNLLKPTLWRLLVDIARFYRKGQQYLAEPTSDAGYTIGDMLRDGGYSDEFVELHLVPMGSAVWSANPDQFRKFPAESLLRFLDNHGLLGWGDRPEWRTVVNGSKSYVDAIERQFTGTIHKGRPVNAIERQPDGVTVRTANSSSTYDRVVLACHSDQSMQILANPTPAETSVLSNITYQPNEAVLHTDISLLAPEQRAWAAWNYYRPAKQSASELGATVTYDMTTLQRLSGQRRYLVSLNSSERIDPSTIIGRYNYAHPVFTTEAINAQRRLHDINGVDRIFFAGAWQGYGFHEDGMASAVRVCESMGVTW